MNLKFECFKIYQNINEHLVWFITSDDDDKVTLKLFLIYRRIRLSKKHTRK